MAYDEALAERIRRALGPRADVSERKMFGGIAFLLDGKMFVGIVGDELMVRVGPERQAEALARPHVRVMDFTGKPMKGYVYVAAAGCKDVRAVKRWAEWGAEVAAALPAARSRTRARPRPLPRAAKRRTKT